MFIDDLWVIEIENLILGVLVFETAVCWVIELRSRRRLRSTTSCIPRSVSGFLRVLGARSRSGICVDHGLQAEWAFRVFLMPDFSGCPGIVQFSPEGLLWGLCWDF